jgi:hypothetical protein
VSKPYAECFAGFRAGFLCEQTRHENANDYATVKHLPALPGFFLNCKDGELINVYYLCNLPIRVRKMTRQSRRSRQNDWKANRNRVLGLPGFSKTNPAGRNRVWL